MNTLYSGNIYNPPFFLYIYWIVTFVKLTGLLDQEMMGDSSFTCFDFWGLSTNLICKIGLKLFDVFRFYFVMLKSFYYSNGLEGTPTVPWVMSYQPSMGCHKKSRSEITY